MTRIPWTTIAEAVAIVAHGVRLLATVERDEDRWTWSLTEDDGSPVKQGSSRTREGARRAVCRAARLDGYILSILRRRSGAAPVQGTLPGAS